MKGDLEAASALDEVSAAGEERAALDALYRLAQRAADEGHYQRVSQLFREARDAGALSRPEAWRTLLLEAGDFEAARALAPLGEPERSAPLGEAGPDAPGDEDFLDFDAGEPPKRSDALPRSLVDRFYGLFRGRGDVYARQWFDARKGRTGYWPVRDPLTRRAVEEHLLGKHTLGQYLLFPDETVAFAVLDLDPTPEALEHDRLARDDREAIAPESLASAARRLARAAESAGLAPMVESTGGDGMHVWLFFEPRLPAAEARAALREIVCRAGPLPPSVALEIFPKQDRLTGKGLGNLIKLPLGVHQATMRRSVFLASDGSVLPDEDALARIRFSDPEAVRALLRAKVVPLRADDAAAPASAVRGEATARDDGSRPGATRMAAETGPRALAEALASIEPGREAERAVDAVLAGCAVLRELSRRAFEDPTLPSDAARALVYTVGLIGRRNERIESMLRAAGVSSKELDRVRCGLQAPMGCRRLKELFAPLASACACPRPSDGLYATPVLLAFERLPRPGPRRPVPASDAALVEGPWQPAPHDLEQRLERIEQAVRRLLERIE